ncbi:MAG: AraC family transcriptional regulator [Halioglobus sp.]|nr:AraC family transcriptional regulator [Halioglobus sp.]
MTEFPAQSIRARGLYRFGPLVTSLGGRPEELLAACGISKNVLSDPESTLLISDMAALLELAADRLERPDFSLQLGQEQGIAVLGLVATIALNSTTVAEALESIAHYLPYHSSGARLSLAEYPEDGLSAIHYSLNLDPGAPRRQLMELTYMVAYRFLCMVTSTTQENWRVHFRHERGLTAEEYAHYFNCPVRMAQAHDELLFPTRILAHRINSNDVRLRQMAERFVGNEIRRFPLDIGRQIEELVDRQLAHGGASIKYIAGQMSQHPRTLERRLQAQDLVFRDIVDRVRRTRASEYLAQSVIPLSQVAALLGYSSQTSLNRACLRWFGQTPNALRRKGTRGSH